MGSVCVQVGASGEGVCVSVYACGVLVVVVVAVIECAVGGCAD